MRWVCFQTHATASGFSLRFEPRVYDTFTEWLFCHVTHDHELTLWLARIGFIDFKRHDDPLGLDGAQCRWRWDFWNAITPRIIRDHERREWEKKAAAARRRWGVGAG